jgi:hypothetical protein
MAKALGDRAGMGTASNNFGFTLEKTGDLPAAVARALMFGLIVPRIAPRVSLFEHQERRGPTACCTSCVARAGADGVGAGRGSAGQGARELAHRLGGGSDAAGRCRVVTRIQTSGRKCGWARGPRWCCAHWTDVPAPR